MHPHRTTRPRRPRPSAVAAAVVVAAGAIAAPATAGVKDDRNLEIDSTRDFVLLENYPEGETVRVDVLRPQAGGGFGLIGTTTREVEATEGPRPNSPRTTVEINHVGGGQPADGGDCWSDGVVGGVRMGTPDIAPGDKVVATLATEPPGADSDHTWVRRLNYLESPDGRVQGQATGVEAADGSFDLGAPIPVDVEAGVFIEAKRVNRPAGTFREFVSPDPDSDPPGSFDTFLPGGPGGEITLQWASLTADDGAESTVTGPQDEEREAVAECPPFTAGSAAPQPPPRLPAPPAPPGGAGPSPTSGPGASSGPGGDGTGAVAGESAFSARIGRISLASRVSLRRALLRGIGIRFRVPRGAGVAQARMFALTNTAGRRGALVGRRTLRGLSPGLVRLTLRPRSLARGRYLIEVRAGSSAAALGPGSVKTLRVIR